MEESTQGSIALERCGGWREGGQGDMMGTAVGILGGGGRHSIIRVQWLLRLRLGEDTGGVQADRVVGTVPRADLCVHRVCPRWRSGEGRMDVLNIFMTEWPWLVQERKLTHIHPSAMRCTRRKGLKTVIGPKIGGEY